uniref:Spindle and centriole-associated protein 1 n=1 Tax=Strix occidentalis caurina TaxID=311401 RepID=A0A8D0FY36_STROC
LGKRCLVLFSVVCHSLLLIMTVSSYISIVDLWLLFKATYIPATLFVQSMETWFLVQSPVTKSYRQSPLCSSLFCLIPLGFPNVTMAPNRDLGSSQGPIVQKCDPPTQLSILSESVADAQVIYCEQGTHLSSYRYFKKLFLGCTDNLESCYCPIAIHCYTCFECRLLQLLREENSLVNSPLWAEKDMRKTTLSQESNVPLTPTTVSPSLDQSALNATSVVKRIHSRLQNEDDEETVDSTYTVRQVLNPNSRKQNQIAAKSLVLLKITYLSLTKRDNKSSLDVLNRMIHEVERELEEYEQCTGREVQKTERSEGLTGFTLSLVNALCRLMRYLKESEMQLREKEVMRQQHEEMLNEHRELIDALTAEILLVREENTTIQKKLQQYMTVTDEQLISLTEAFKGLPLVESRREQKTGVAGRGVGEKPDLSYFEPRAGAGNREGMLKFPQEELPFKILQRSGASGGAGAGRSLPSHVFQPAVLLSPPRQKSSQELSPLQNGEISLAVVDLRVCVVRSCFNLPPENTEREPCKERSLPSCLRTQSTTEENCVISQRQPIPPADKELESSHEKISLSCPGDTRKNSSAEELFQNGDLLGQIAELTRQNSLIKAQLSKFRGFSEDTSDCLHQPDPNTHLVVSKSLEERIAELNRQSTEARDKLLQLIDQQKLVAADTVPPMISPGLSPSLNYTGKYRASGERKTSKTMFFPFWEGLSDWISSCGQQYPSGEGCFTFSWSHWSYRQNCTRARTRALSRTPSLSPFLNHRGCIKGRT